jgi:pimeloyl-ACP methyl ester carboxylesterase
MTPVTFALAILAGLAAPAVGVWLWWNLRMGLWVRFAPRRKHRPGRNPYGRYGRPFRAFEVESEPGILLRGWYVEGDPRYPAVVLCHAYDSSKCSSLPRMGVLPPQCPVVFFDFRAHGESTGAECTLIAGETRDLEAVLGHARGLGARRFILWGRCYSSVCTANVAARRGDIVGLVLEGPLLSLESLIDQRLYETEGLPAWMFPLGLWLIRRRLARGVPYRALPELAAAMVGKHVLILTAQLDPRSARRSAKLMESWRRVGARECRMPAVHGDIMGVATAAHGLRSRLEHALGEMVRDLMHAPRPGGFPPEDRDAERLARS